MNNLEYKAAYTPKKLTAENRKLNIPIYQRLFVWEEEQINLLLEDLKNAFENDRTTPYYIGIITTVEKKVCGILWMVSTVLIPSKPSRLA